MAKINNKVVSEENYKDYVKLLINKVYQILPVYEGRDSKTKKIIFTPEVAYNQFEQRLMKVLTEFRGVSFFIEGITFIRISNIIAGMSGIGLNRHSDVKGCVFECIDLLKKELE